MLRPIRAWQTFDSSMVSDFLAEKRTEAGSFHYGAKWVITRVEAPLTGAAQWLSNEGLQDSEAWSDL